MADPANPPKPSGFAALTMARFLKETAHLGPEGQKRVLETIRAANQHKRSRLAAMAAIDKAKASPPPDYQVEAERIGLGDETSCDPERRGTPPPQSVNSTPTNEDR